MRKKLTLPILILLSAVGMALQYLSLYTAFDHLNLPITGAPAISALILFVCLCAGISLWLALSLRGITIIRQDGLYCDLSLPGMGIGLVAGALIIVGSLAGLCEALLPILRYRNLAGLGGCLSDVLLLGGGIAVLWQATTPLRPLKSGPALAPLVPGFAGCLWLAVFYQANSRDPAVLRYAWILLALIFFVLATYYQAGYTFRHCRPFWAMLFTGIAAPLLFIAIPTTNCWYEAVLLAGLGLWTLLNAPRIPHCSEKHGLREAN